MKLNNSVQQCDKPRLVRQLDYVFAHMKKHRWQTFEQIENALGFPQPSISARLREIRANGYRVEKKRVKGGNQWQYRVMP